MNAQPQSLAPPDAVRPTRAWAPENTAIAAVAGAVVLILVLAGLGVRALERATSMATWVEHTYRVLRQVDRASASLSTVIASVEGYVITGDEGYLRQREQALSDVDSSLRDMQELTVDNPIQQRQVADLSRTVAARIAISNAVLVARQTGGLADAQQLIEGGQPSALMEQVRAHQLAVVHEEERLLELRERNEHESRQRAMLLAGALIAVVIGVVAIGLGWLRRELDIRRALARTFDTQRRFLESVLEHLPALIVVKDPQTLKFVNLNRATLDWMGRPREAVIGRTVHELLPQAEADAIVVSDRAALQTHGVHDLPENVRYTPDGAQTVLHTRKIAVRDEAGRPLFLLGISTDISERVAFERRISALNEHLEAQKSALEAANRELESFSYSVSHDLRAPLRAIDGFALMLLEDYGPKLDAEAQRFIATIRSGSQRMGQLIDDLLAFSRLGRQQLNRVPVNMEQLLRAGVTEALSDARGAQPTITIKNIPAACGDPALLRHVCGNLLGNAVKYSSRVAAPAITVDAYPDGTQIVYFVRDNGAGFDMQFAHKLFGVFQRLHGNDEFPGTGVGLAIVHRIVTRHGGRVWAESVPGHGSTFYFSLPGAPDT